jgi:ABC-type glycerol-3-phosphate transport system substrate-binding protein
MSSKLSRRQFLGLSATLMASSAALAACGATATPTPPPPPTVAKPAATVAPTAVPTAPKPRIVLVHPNKWLGEADERYPAASKILALFKQKQPNVDVTLIPNPDKNETLKKIQADCAAGACPDLFERADLALWQSGWLLDLAPSIDATWMARLHKPSLELTSWQGKIFGLGTECSPMPMLWNMKVLSQVGETTPPATWEKMIEVGDKLKAKGLYLCSFTLGPGEHLANNICFRQAGALAALEKGDWKNASVRFTLDRMKELIDHKVHPANDLDITWRDGVTFFQNYKMAFYDNGAWGLGQQIAVAGVDPELRNNVQFTPNVSTGPEGTSVEYKIAGAAGLGAHLAKQPDKLAAALDWMKVWSSEEAALIWAEYGQALMAVNVDPVKWAAVLKKVPLFEKFMVGAATGKVQFALGSSSMKVRLRNYDMFLKAIPALILGKGMDAALDAFAAAMDAS